LQAVGTRLEGARPAAVLLDAFGTLVTLDPPLPRLVGGLRAVGCALPEEVVGQALESEMRFYRANHDAGHDAASLAELRRACARVLGEGLGPSAPPLDLLTDLLAASLEFVLLPDAVPALDALREEGYRLAVVSNWDYTLPAELARLGIADRFAAVAVSAAVGARKPSPGLFHWVLDRLEVPASAAVHCGDQPEPDCLGARQAGVRAVIVDRDGRHEEADCPRIGALTELPGLLRDGLP
jgi:putative hydrolase of the HAD superfamily